MKELKGIVTPICKNEEMTAVFKMPKNATVSPDELVHNISHPFISEQNPFTTMNTIGRDHNPLSSTQINLDPSTVKS